MINKTEVADKTTPKLEAAVLVILGQKHSGDGAVRIRDDPSGIVRATDTRTSQTDIPTGDLKFYLAVRMESP